jgi:hypothetical protein
MRIAIVGSSNYGNPDFVRRIVSLVSPDDELVLTSQFGVCHIALMAARTHSLPVRYIQWLNRPHRLVGQVDRIILFYDGTTRYTPKLLRYTRKFNIPVLMYDQSGKCLAELPSNVANAQRGEGMPVVEGLISSKVKLQITLPESLYDEYCVQAAAERVPVEKLLADRLTRCASHTGTRTLYFSDKERNELERITGGHLISSAADALAKIRTTCQVKVGNVVVQLNERVTQRAHARAKATRKAPEEWLRKEVLENLERSVGLRPY